MIDYVTNANNDDVYNYDTNYSVSNSDNNNNKITLEQHTSNAIIMNGIIAI